MMTAPNMATITASLERSLQNCSLNHHHQSSSNSGVLGPRLERSSSSDQADGPELNHRRHRPNSDTTLELNSHLSLPYHWEQCLDLKTGEIYYINWRNGMKTKEDPRITQEYMNGDFYSEDDSSYDSEESSSESSPSSSRPQYHREEEEGQKEDYGVLVVAGCKSCLMYFMLPKKVQDCPKCTAQLLHFDRSENASP